MARRKSKRAHYGQADRKTRSGRSARNYDVRLYNKILALFYLSPEELSSNDLVKKIGGSRSSKHEIEDIVHALSAHNLLHKQGKKRWALSKNHGLLEATFSKNPKGFAFGTVVKAESQKQIPDQDVFIPASRTSSARHGDRVLLKINRVKKGGRAEAEVIHIIKRGASRIPGFFSIQDGNPVVYPEDNRFPFQIRILSTQVDDISEGDGVIVQLSDDAPSESDPTGRIIEVLGDPGTIEVQTRLVIEKHNLPFRFSSESLTEAAHISPEPSDIGREDLTDILHITIDGDDAKDFDDAIAVEKTPHGYRLHVSIADVSAYVQIDSSIDSEAYERGTSIYFPGTVIPMLPENLSNNLCSLIPGEKRLAVTVILEFDSDGQVVAKKFSRSVIKSHHRFTYAIVKEIVEDQNIAVREQHKPFLELLTWASELAQLLLDRRHKRGSIGFIIPEAKITLNENGFVQSITKKSISRAHSIIEEFMLVANETVALTLSDADVNTLYRIHEEPDQEKLSEFIDFAASLGIRIPSAPYEPSWYNEILKEVAHGPYEYMVNNLLLRTMQQARYSHQNFGHYGLAAEHYTHFTSPIRRYPDLVVHRLLCSLIDGSKKLSKRQKVSPEKSLKENGLHLSARERVAITGERDMLDRLKLQFMSDKLGESFWAIVSGVSESKLYIELTDFFISGVIPLSSMTDDYYLLDAKRHRLIGDISAKIYQIGDTLSVTVSEVNYHHKQIYFTISPNPENAK